MIVAFTKNELKDGTKRKLSEYSNDLENRVEGSVIVEENYSTTNGYVRWGNGFQIAWKVENAQFTAQPFGPLYYSDHTFGNWAKSFTVVFDLKHTANSLQYWTATNLTSSLNGGNVRLYRPNNATGGVEVRAVAIGRWK